MGAFSYCYCNVAFEHLNHYDCPINLQAFLWQVLMAEELPKFESELEWQIDRRARIQKLLFRFWDFLERHSEFPDERDDHWTIMCWMVDSGFSLWRSAFLTDTVRDRRKVYDHMKEFIRKLLEHNAITFADDHRMRELSVGYYNANARYRLERIHTCDPRFLELDSVRALADLRKNKIDLSKEKQAELWDIYYAALVDCFDAFQTTWTSEMRPGRQIKGPDAATAATDNAGSNA